jgi:hypothetical protein
MTCVVAIARDGVVYMGADHAVESFEKIRLCPRPKVAITSDHRFIIGYSGIVHEGNMVLAKFCPPPLIPNADPDKVAQTICDHMTWMYGSRRCECMFLIGYEGRLYMVCSADSTHATPFLLCQYPPEQHDCIGVDAAAFDRILVGHMRSGEDLSPQSLISLTIYDASRSTRGVGCFDNGPTLVSL